MRLNQKVKYAVACLFELSNNPGEYLDVQFMAMKQGIPQAYAHKILQSLAHAGLTFSTKGVGYRLARPLSEITALEVMEALTVDAEHSKINTDAGVLLEKRVNQALGTVKLAELVA